MAEQGFNICMVSRNEEKMQQKLQEITQKTSGNVKTMCVVADFAALHTYEDYEKALAPLKEIDIAMLFLNAGIG